MNYPAHGCYDIQFYDEIVLIRFEGATNAESIRNFLKDIETIGEGFSGRKWAQLVDLRRWELAPPEVFTEVKKSEDNMEILKNRCSAQVIITDNTVIKGVVSQLTNDPIFIDPEFSESIENAFLILERAGYSGFETYKKSEK
jgi:hypothetical protein